MFMDIPSLRIVAQIGSNYSIGVAWEWRGWSNKGGILEG